MADYPLTLLLNFYLNVPLIPKQSIKNRFADEVVYFQNAPRCIGVGSFPVQQPDGPFSKREAQLNPCDKHELNDFPLNSLRRDSFKKPQKIVKSKFIK